MLQKLLEADAAYMIPARSTYQVRGFNHDSSGHRF